MYLEGERGLLAMKLLAEGSSVRTVERVTGFHRNTILKLLLTAGARYDELLSAKIRGLRVQDVQCDEIWGFVYKKRKSKTGAEENFAYIGDAWVFVAIERKTKLVLAYELGKRTVSSASRFRQKLATATHAEQRFQLTTDGLNAYNYAVGTVLGDRVDYAQLIKIYAATPLQPSRSSRGDSDGSIRRPRQNADLHQPHRTAESHDANVYAAADAANQRILKEMGESAGGPGAALRVL
jgi:IS1 family transposase